MQQFSSKRKYHPLVILFYSSGMLTYQQKQDIPKSTRADWNHFNNEENYGFDWVEKYMNQFDDIKQIYSKQYLYSATRFMCNLSSGYDSLINTVVSKKKLLAENSSFIVESIERMNKKFKLNIKSACKLFKVDINWYYRQKNKTTCNKNIFNSCFRQRPNQLTYNEVRNISDLMSAPENSHKNKTTIYYEGIRNEIIAFGKTTFFKYCRQLGYTRLPKLPVKARKGFKSTKPFEALHIDVTFVPILNGGVQKVAFVKDNYSTALLHYGSTEESADSEFIKTLLEETFIKYKLYEHPDNISIISDGGSENKGAVLEWVASLVTPPMVKKITAHTPDFPFSNNMSESTHRIYKSEFMQSKLSADKDKHEKDLTRFFDYYNTKRFPTLLFGLSPKEVLDGAQIDRHLFSEKIAIAKLSRLETNRNFNQCEALQGYGM